MHSKNLSILISIKPVYVELIFSGNKTVELRRVLPKNLPDNTEVIIYASSPTKSIVGKARIKNIEEQPIEKLWKNFGDRTGITFEYFKEYFKGKDKGYGLILDRIEKFSVPYPLCSLRDTLNFSPPQSYMYTPSSLMEIIQ
jgi:predicted transcriptional regulator